MAITFVSENVSPTTGVVDSVDVTKPSGLAVGDVMIAFIHSDQQGITAPGAHWTRIYQQDDNSSSSTRQEMWYCVATTTETAATRFTWGNGGTASFFVALLAYRGVDQTNPINAHATNVGTSGTSQSGPSITTTATCLVLHARSIRKSSGTSSVAFSSSQVERVDTHNSGTGGVGYSGAVYDTGVESEAGAQSGLSIAVNSASNMTDTFSTTLALKTGNVATDAGGPAAAAVAALGAVALSGQSTSSGRAAATASAKSPTVITGYLVNAGKAAATVAVKDIGRRAHPTTAEVDATGEDPKLFFGTPGYRTRPVPYESRTLRVEQS